MKIRNGFVSNSSSSSFVLLSLGNFQSYSLLNKMGIDTEDDNWTWNLEKNKEWSYWGHGMYQHEKSKLLLAESDGEVQGLGLDIITLLKEDWRLSEMKNRMIRLIKEDFSMEIDSNDIHIEKGISGE